MASRSVVRAIEILDFLTTHPGRGFTMSELSRRLRISKATAHAILAALTDRRLLVRNAATNEYRLGPALVPMGAVAERGLPALTHARREAIDLAEEHDAECILTSMAADEMLVVARVGVPRPQSITPNEGTRFPLAPPAGTAALAWAPEGAIDEWFDRTVGTALNDAERDRYRAALGSIRQRGYMVSFRVEQLVDFGEIWTTADVYTPQERRKFSAALDAVAHDRNFLRAADDMPADTEVHSISAPIFGPEGTLLFVITLLPTGRVVTDIPDLSRAVVRSAGRVMAAVDGRPPVPQLAQL